MSLARNDISKYTHVYTTEDGFEGEISMNPRDAMVFAEIKKLPSIIDKPLNAVAVSEFSKIIKNYGAKATINISSELLKLLPENTLQSTNGVGRYISRENAEKAISSIKNKNHIKEQLNKFVSGEYKFLTKDDLKSRTAELSEFKILHSSFVDKTKIENGLYSTKAEEEKLNNDFVEHYAIEHKDKIIACVMHFMHGGKTYDADFVVHPDYRSRDIHPETLDDAEKNYPHGLSQALCVKVFEHIKDKYPNVTGSWFIAGGYGGLGVGAYLYDTVFPTQTIQGNPDLQDEIGMFLVFDKPGKELILASNRNTETLKVNADELEYVKEALAILDKSREPDLAAKQPVKLISNPTFFGTPKTTNTEPLSPVNYESKISLNK